MDDQKWFDSLQRETKLFLDSASKEALDDLFDRLRKETRPMDESNDVCLDPQHAAWFREVCSAQQFVLHRFSGVYKGEKARFCMFCGKRLAERQDDEGKT